MLRIHSPGRVIEPDTPYRLDDSEIALRPGWYLVDVRVLDVSACKITENPDTVSFGHSGAYRVERVLEVAR